LLLLEKRGMELEVLKNIDFIEMAAIIDD